MGIDISSKSTGWSIIEDDNLLEYGKINPTGKMSTAQKLCLFSIELNKIIDAQKPDAIAIEDVVQVKSVSVAKILARFNGVAIVEAYKYLQKDPPLYEPSKWKKVLEDCSGSSKKCEIQLSVCKIYNLLTKEKISFYKDRIEKAKASSKLDVDETRLLIKQLKKDMKKAKKAGESLADIEEQILSFNKRLKKDRKSGKKQMSKEFDKISMDIYAETSINEDIADAIGVARAYQKDLK